MTTAFTFKDSVSSRQAKLDLDSSVLVNQFPHPPFLFKNDPRKEFSTFLVDENGSSNMVVDGSTTPVSFELGAASEGIRFVTQLGFIICDMNARLDKFGALDALTNGVRVEHLRSGETISLYAPIKSNFDLSLGLCRGVPAFGSGNDSFRASSQVGSSPDWFPPVLDFPRVFGLDPGLCLPFNSQDVLRVIIQDDLAGIDIFTVHATGYDLIRKTS